MKQRIEKLQNTLSENEAALIFSAPNRFYFTDFHSSAGVLLVTARKSFFLVDFRYFEKAKQVITSVETVLCTNMFGQLFSYFSEFKIKTVFLETESLNLSLFSQLKENFNGIEISDSTEIQTFINQMRSVKDKCELDAVKTAQKLTDNAFEYILNKISVGKTEKEIALELEFYMRKNGADGIAFDTIAVSGKNSSLPHGVPGDKKLQKGDFLTLDFGAKYNGYCSDMTRTIAFGTVTDKQRFVYETVLKAQQKALNAIKSGVVCKNIDAIARDFINESGFENCFGHGLGHSVGLEIHETPCFNTRDNTLLSAGAVITVEPGIYLENEFGVRIEDMVYVTEKGCENLTNSPKELIIL